MSRRRVTGLQMKLVFILLVIGLMPVLVSAVLIERIAEVAQNFSSNEVAKLTPALEKAEDAYRAAVTQTKAVHGQAAARVVAEPEAARDPELRDLGLVRATVRASPDHSSFVHETGRPLGPDERLVRVTRGEDPRVELEFAVDGGLARDYRELGAALAESRRVRAVRHSLPASYQTAFVVLVGGFAIVLTTLGLLLGRRVIRRIDELVEGFRTVARGELSARVSGQGRDELAEMGRAFNRMVADLDSERRKAAHLQRIGTWQDVARKLAHEIKNPLTPIQLAVQQVESSYRGDDQRFARTVADAGEIVREEIDNLRRLVDAFRELGRLPPVEPAPIDLQVIVDDLGNDPVVADSLRTVPPEQPVRVHADRLLLRRLLHNLIENGIQASGDAVVMSWRAGPDGRAEIVVDDGGTGIDADVARTLFEPYVTTKETGTGLGLAISMKIAIEHGGALELSDEPSPLGGARFVLTVPMAA